MSPFDLVSTTLMIAWLSFIGLVVWLRYKADQEQEEEFERGRL